MELKLLEFQQPKDILFNYNELKHELEKKCEMYETLVYTEEQIPEAKKDRANLNKLDKALNDERIRLEREYNEPFTKFKAQIEDLRAVIKKASSNCDKQIKESEDLAKQKKKEAIQKHFDTIAFPSWVTFEMIFDEKWLNSSVSMKSIQTQIDEICAKIEQDLVTLENLPEFSFEATEEYKRSLNLSQAIQEGQRLAEIQKRKLEAEEEAARRKAEQEFAQHMNPPVEEPKAETPVEVIAPQRQWIGFKANLTVEEAHQLKNFFECRGIEFEPIAI